MRLVKNISVALCSIGLVLSGVACSDKLDLAPIDYYGSGNFWQSKEQVSSSAEALNFYLRELAHTHSITLGELRGGHYRNTSTGTDGMTLLDGDIRLQNLDRDHTGGMGSYGTYFGAISNLNQFLQEVERTTLLPEAQKKYYLGMGHGLRAFYYFDLYRTYGKVPLRLTPDVQNGVIDPIVLYKEQSAPSAVYAQIESDIKASIDNFDGNRTFTPYGHGNKVSWTLAATEALAADFYLWSAKVTTGDKSADPSLLPKAKQHLQSLIDNYGLSLQTNFAGIFSTTNKANSEVIMAVRYADGEAENQFGNWTYNLRTGSVNKSSFRADGTPWNDYLELGTSNALQSREYSVNLFNLFDDADTRKAATFVGSYIKDPSTGALSLAGTHVRKNIGHINTQGNRVFDGDLILYRLAWVYLSLAEVANMEGDNSNVERYINMIRQRAYGSNWNAATHGYTAGGFRQNELAILTEKDKEFVQEGQRWWDLRRMKESQNGQHLVFVADAHLTDNTVPVLNPNTQAYKVLWPLDASLLSNDPKLTQTEGYN